MKLSLQNRQFRIFQTVFPTDRMTAISYSQVSSTDHLNGRDLFNQNNRDFNKNDRNSKSYSIDYSVSTIQIISIKSSNRPSKAFFYMLFRSVCYSDGDLNIPIQILELVHNSESVLSLDNHSIFSIFSTKSLKFLWIKRQPL